MRLTIYHEISHSGQFEGTEFIDDNSLLWFLTPVNDGTCHLLGHKFGRRTDNASILMKFCTQHKSRTVISMVTIGFCNFWRLSILTPVSIGTCHLLGHSFGRKTANVSILMKFCTLHKSKVGNSITTIVFCDSRSLSNLAPVNIGTCHHLGHSFELIKFETLHKSKTLNSMVTKFFYNFWRLSILIPVNVSTCQILGQSYGPRTANASILLKFCTLNKSRVANSMVTIVFCDSWRRSNLTLLNIGTYHILGHKFGWRTANASILMKLCTLHKSKTLSSMVTIVFCSFWRPSVKFDTCQFWHR